MRLDQLLVENGMARSRSRATQLISAGLVTVNGKVIHKPAYKIEPDDVLAVQHQPQDDYVSRAAFKLARTCEAIGTENLVLHKTAALDIGASTGGFTQVLLLNGVEHVVSLDVGHDQLVPELRNDERVTVIEGFNARNLTVNDLPYRPEVIVSDVSFISLTHLIPAIASVATSVTETLLMVKPQFEVGKEHVSSSGVVTDPVLHVSAINQVVQAGYDCGLAVHAIIPSALPGPHGNREFFVWFRSIIHPNSGYSDTVGEGNTGFLDEQHYRDVVARTVERAVLGKTPAVTRKNFHNEDAVTSGRKARGIPQEQDVPKTEVYWVRES
ncbi:TlyA family RNA methyltransferase [Timonella sp. A28]|uniref:TlyA family RNA methyltransferase n=1 Tax=Timonella sp. A28 TaxID=3442640 RepID=UPI003EB6CC0E